MLDESMLWWGFLDHSPWIMSQQILEAKSHIKNFKSFIQTVISFMYYSQI